jgi:hypothetical protein
MSACAPMRRDVMGACTSPPAVCNVHHLLVVQHGKEITTKLGNGSEIEDPLDQDAGECACASEMVRSVQ